ncbi:MAG: type 1 glutamine amidotransferase [Aquificae bacterium]|nr:type 1 glutamine amidotransferase [Aquificota bacterium]
MKKIALLLEELVEDVEFIYPFYRFKEEHFHVDVLAPKIKEFKGKKGMTFYPNKQIDADLYREYDAVFIPGGYAPDRFRRDRETIEFVKNMNKERKVIAAICHAPWVLISAKIIKGKKVTGFFSIKDDLINAGAVYTGHPVERDGNIITGTDPKAMPEMVKIVIKAINGE